MTGTILPEAKSKMQVAMRWSDEQKAEDSSSCSAIPHV